MNKFATILPINRFSATRVKIYTVQIEEDGANRSLSEFDDWILKHRGDRSIQKEINEIRNWIRAISEGKHDLSKLLRHEGSAHALPPRQKFLEIEFSKQLRLYGMVIGNKTLILFNGGIKTTRTAQDCLNVSQFFYEANKLCKAIENALKERTIDLDYDSGIFNNPEKTEIEL